VLILCPGVPDLKEGMLTEESERKKPLLNTKVLSQSEPFKKPLSHGKLV